MIVITGSTGNVGRPLVRALAQFGEQVTAVSRRGGAGAEGVHVAKADLSDPGSLPDVFRGARALFLHDGGASAETLKPRDILEAATSAGVARVVLLSSQGVGTRPESRSHGMLLRSFEDAVQESGLEWTILRPSGFTSNVYAWSATISANRTVAAPFGDVGLPVVDPADVAGVAAAALREGGHAGKTYVLTGPELTTPRQRAAAIGEALGEPVRFVEQSLAEAREQMLHFMPEWAVGTTLAMLGAPTPAEREISSAAGLVLGRAPRTFAEWARDHVAAFR